MKKTLIITLEYPPQIGGIATYVHDLASALDPVSTIVLAPLHPQAKSWDEQVNYKVIRKSLLYPKFVLFRWSRLCWQVRKIVKQEKIELIMVHHVLPVGYVGWLIKKFQHVPFLLFSHGTDLIAGTATKWKTTMLTMVAKSCAQIIFNSESLQRRFLEKLPDFSSKSLVMYPCPEQDFFSSPPAEEIEKLRTMYALNGKYTMLSISRMEEGKGFPHLIRIMPELLKRAPHLVWLIVGDGSKKNEIVQLIQKNNLQNVVRFIGQLPHAELKKYYYLADLFVLLTHPNEGREEGLGLVFLEASAAGRAIVAGRSGGVEEAIIDGQTGFVIDVHQDDLMIEKIAELLTDQAKAKMMGEAGRARMLKDFVWGKQLEKIKKWTDK